MSKRLFNFSAGPATLPPEVLDATARALIDYAGMGAGIAELSHRGPELDAVFDETTARIRALMDVPPEYDVLYLQGGASQLFATIPMCFLHRQADYLVNGEWAQKAAEANVRSAIPAVEAYYADNEGSATDIDANAATSGYQGMTTALLQGIDAGVKLTTIKNLTTTSYCVEYTGGGKSARKIAASGQIEQLACP